MSRTASLTAAIVGALALTSAATDDEIATAINSLKADRDTAKATNSQHPSLDKYVPRSDYDVQVSRATNAEQQLKTRDDAAHKSAVDIAIGEALKAGKITPASEDYHRASCSDASGLERFKVFAGAAPVIADKSSLDAKKPPATGTALNAEERAVAQMTGVSDADFIAARDAHNAVAAG